MRQTSAAIGALLLLVAAVAPAAGAAGAATTGQAGTAVEQVGADGVGAGAASVQEDCTFPVTVTDKTGTEVTVEEEPERLVALGPSAAQNLWAIGAQDRVVGMPVDYHTGYLNGTEGKEDVMNDEGQVITERVVGAEPDVVLAANIVPNETVQTLRDSGLTVYKFDEAGSLEDVYDKIERYGLLVGNYEEAGRVSAEMQGQVDAISEAVAEEENPRVYFSLGGGWTAGENSFIGHLIESAGGDNIAAGHLNSSYGQLSDEIVAQEDPEWIVVNGEFGTVPQTAAFNESTAVQEGNLVTVNRDFMSQNGPKNVQPLRTMADAFHPEAYESVDLENVETPEPVTCAAVDTPTQSPTPTATETPGDSEGTATDAQTTTDAMADGDETATADDGAETPTPTAADGPGFGVAAAFLALLGAALLVRRD